MDTRDPLHGRMVGAVEHVESNMQSLVEMQQIICCGQNTGMC